ncbi:MAG: dihydrofolate reductase [Porticoccaceae bacterium]|jgi:dihydrofolate reductase
MKVALIVAVSQNNVIGRDNQLPWHLPEDLQYFKSITMGKPILMGRKTYDSIGRPLPGRTNIVITRDPNWTAEGVEVVNSLEAAMTAGAEACNAVESDEIMVIGGAQIYRDCLPMADKLYLTKVDADIQGDAFFPEIDTNQWQKTSEKTPAAVDKHPYRFLILERI